MGGDRTHSDSKSFGTAEWWGSGRRDAEAASDPEAREFEHQIFIRCLQRVVCWGLCGQVN